jgi:flagellar biosynthetic protein FliQ
MSTDLFLFVTRESLLLALLLSAPALLVALVVGLVVSVVQAATQVHEQTVSATPKIAAVIAVLILTGLWMLRELASFATMVFDLIGDAGHGLGS